MFESNFRNRTAKCILHVQYLHFNLFLSSPAPSRPCSPKSDTEFEKLKGLTSSSCLDDGDEDDDVKWPWGELPDAGVIAKVKVSVSGVQEDPAQAKGEG